MYWLLIILCGVILVYAFAAVNMRLAGKNLYG